MNSFIQCMELFGKKRKENKDGLIRNLLITRLMKTLIDNIDYYIIIVDIFTFLLSYF